MKACIIYVPSDGIDPNPTKAKLESKGYTVILCPIAVHQAKDATKGKLDTLTDEMRNEIETCDFPVFIEIACHDGNRATIRVRINHLESIIKSSIVIA